MAFDQHFTKPEEADRLVRSLLHRLDPARVRRYIEPACGEGAFVEALHQAGIPRRRIRSVEIDRKLPADVHQDFLASTRESLGLSKWNPETTVVVGNPPFGRNGKVARQFLNKASEYANWVCFILPRSMHDARGCSSVNPRMELIYEREINGSFDTTKAKCNWQEWVVLPKGQRGCRPKDGVTDTQGLYEIVPLGKDHDLVIQRCGGSAGRVTTCNRTGQGKYYIRTRYPAVRRAFKNLSTHAAANLTTHQDSLSARMLHELLERSLLSQYIRTIKGEI